MFRVNRLKIVLLVVRVLFIIRITVSKESNFLPCCKGTVIPDNYIESRKSSFQAHLERISNFLITGPGVWWEKGNGTVVFRDSNKDLCFREQGPSLRHFHRTFVLENRDHLYDTSTAVVSQMYSILLL